MLGTTIAILTAITITVIATADESGPSNTCGFVTATVSDQPEFLNHITIQPRGTEINGDFTEIWGSQFIGGTSPTTSDLLEEFSNYSWLNKWRLPTGTWLGTMTGIDHNKSYIFRNRHGAGAVTKVFCGDVIPEGTLVDMGTIVDYTNSLIPGQPAHTFVANPLPLDRQISGVPGDIYNLIGSGFSCGHAVGDLIHHYNGTNWTNCFTMNGVNWFGTITALEAGKGYEIVDFTHGSDWNWTFTVGTDSLVNESATKQSKAASQK